MNSLPPILFIIVFLTLVVIAASYFLARIISKRSGKITQLKAFTICLVVGLAICFFIVMYIVTSMFENV